MGRNGAAVGKGRDVCGVGWCMAGKGWRGKVTFFWVRGSECVGCGRGGAAGVCVGASGGNLVSKMANARRWPQVQSRARGQAVGEGDGFGRSW